MKAQSLPHHGLKNGYTRSKHIVCLHPASIDYNGQPQSPQFKEFPSISAAKRYMRTGQ